MHMNGSMQTDGLIVGHPLCFLHVNIWFFDNWVTKLLVTVLEISEECSCAISTYVAVTPCKSLITAPIPSTSGAYCSKLDVVDHCVLCWVVGFIRLVS